MYIRSIYPKKNIRRKKIYFMLSSHNVKTSDKGENISSLG